MSDYDHGPYTPPSERPLAFDRRPAERRRGPFPATLVLSALVLAGLVGGVAFIYRHGVRQSGPPPVVGTSVADIKTPAPAAPPADNEALTIDKDDADTSAPPTFAPPPEAPQPRPVQAVTQPPPPPPPPPTATAAPSGHPLSIAALADAASASGPAASQPGAESWVQIGAFSSPALADQEWTALAKLEPAAMAGKGKKVEPFEKDGENLYRTYITGFSDRSEAETFCGRLKADGRSCLIK